MQEKIGPPWTERGRPPVGYCTKRTAESWLLSILDEARRGTLPAWFGPASRSPMLLLAAPFTGPRTGELLALHWRDVEFAGATIRARRRA